MLKQLKARAFEALRCTRHNFVHLKWFNVRYDGRMWHVTDRRGVHIVFPVYPYRVFFETEGYLRQGKWPLEEGMTVVDGGAYYGEFALYASRCVGKTGRVLVLEPDAGNLRRAEEYFAFNGGKPENVELIPAGIWKNDGVLRFAGGLEACSTLLDAGQPVPPGAQIVDVPVESLNSLVKRYGLKRLDYLKFDIEGAEVEVIESAGDIIQRFKPRFSIASYHRREGKPSSETLEPMFRNYGYAVATGFPEHQTTWAAPTL